MCVKTALFVVVFTVFIPLSNAVGAVPLRYAFTGRIGTVSTEVPFNWNVATGDSISGVLSYDPTVAGSPVDSNTQTNYLQAVSSGISVRIGDNFLQSSNYVVAVENSKNDGLSFLNFGSGGTSDEVIIKGATANARLLIGFVSYSGGTLSSMDLPVSFNGDDFDIRTGIISDMTKLDSSITLQIDSLRQIPEPSGAMLAMLAGVGFVTRRWTRGPGMLTTC